ncbi:hypothetical protein P691DRAFT_783507, partial [Macrolepiota fuliginosa MF-IS2]
MDPQLLDGSWVCMLEWTMSITKLGGVKGVTMVADVEYGTQVVHYTKLTSTSICIITTQEPTQEENIGKHIWGDTLHDDHVKGIKSWEGVVQVNWATSGQVKEES